ncbi:hypothetical protein FRC02_008895 [Tulasnella sp. 418]|nr:hypothetical protein FRC02_008895 [Tulasnella sp. 418]
MTNSRPPLPPDARRLQVIILAAPVLAVTSYILYRRFYLGEEQRKFERPLLQESRLNK